MTVCYAMLQSCLPLRVNLSRLEYWYQVPIPASNGSVKQCDTLLAEKLPIYAPEYDLYLYSRMVWKPCPWTLKRSEKPLRTDEAFKPKKL
jgi:hypothetical protein